MKRITKTNEPAELRDFKAKSNPDWEPSYDGMSGWMAFYSAFLI